MSERVTSNFQSSGSMGVLTLIKESGNALELTDILNSMSEIMAQLAIESKVPIFPLMSAFREIVQVRYAAQKKPEGVILV